MSPQVAFYQMQTTKTMGLRIRAQSASATKIAMMLEEHPMVDIVEHPMVDIVRYPGLPSFPQKELADKYHRDGVHGSMMNFEVKGGTESGRKMMNSINRTWSL